MDGDLLFAVMLAQAIAARGNCTDEHITALVKQCAHRTKVAVEAMRALEKPKDKKEK